MNSVYLLFFLFLLIYNVRDLSNACTIFAMFGYFDCLKYAHKLGCEWNYKTSENAALVGSLECLKYLHENGCPWDSKVCEKASNLQCLKYAHENGCEWYIIYLFVKSKRYSFYLFIKGMQRVVQMQQGKEI